MTQRKEVATLRQHQKSGPAAKTGAVMKRDAYAPQRAPGDPAPKPDISQAAVPGYPTLTGGPTMAWTGKSCYRMARTPEFRLLLRETA
jgi:hypothetical protein